MKNENIGTTKRRKQMLLNNKTKDDSIYYYGNESKYISAQTQGRHCISSMSKFRYRRQRSIK